MHADSVCMNTLLVDKNSLFHQDDGGWNDSSQVRLAVNGEQPTESTPAAKQMLRIEPSLLARLSCRVPGVYQAGE